MPSKSQPTLFVVDGSNIATEGRSVPSLAQLNDAVLAFIEERPDVLITVVVDATFGHRIHKSESAAFDEAVANNELVTPPAGAVGRGDAFVLSIANKANAGILSNDSFQEFHGDYDWLFDEGRLVGGKPVPHVGWVFVTRTPVRGPKSRQSVRESKADATDAKERANRRIRPKTASATSGPSGATDAVAAPSAAVASDTDAAAGSSQRARGRRRSKPTDSSVSTNANRPSATPSATRSAEAPVGSGVNDLVAFLEFAQRHPVGTSCTGVVEAYASHGAYVRVDDVLVYIPLRLMDDPVPLSARSVLTIGDAVSVVIVGYVPDRRSIDAALPHMSRAEAPSAAVSPRSGSAPSGGPRSRRQSASARARAETMASTGDEQPSDAGGVSPKPTRPTRSAPKARARESSPGLVAPAENGPVKSASGNEASADQAPAKRGRARQSPANNAPGKQTPATQGPVKQAPAKSASAKSASVKSASAKQASAKQASAKSASAKSASAKSASAKSAPVKSAPVKSASVKSAPAKQPSAKQASAKQASAKSASAKQASAKQASAKQPSAKQPSAKQPSAKQPSAKQPSAKQAPARRAPARKVSDA